MSSPPNFRLELRDTRIESSIHLTPPGPHPDYSYYELVLQLSGKLNPLLGS